MTLALLLALLVGASLVLLGAGGSIVTVPVLVYAAGLDAHRAAGTSLLVVGLVAIVGSLARRRSVVLRIGLVFGGAGMVGAIAGAWLNHQVDSGVVLAAFAVTLLVAARRMARSGEPLIAASAPGWLVTPTCGAAVGVATGFFGVGGGFLIVPALTLCLAIPMETAVATSLLIIALNCAAGLGTHILYNAVEWKLGLQFTAAALVGAALALPVAQRLPQRALRRLFAGALVLLGLAILVQLLLARAQ